MPYRKYKARRDDIVSKIPITYYAVIDLTTYDLTALDEGSLDDFILTIKVIAEEVCPGCTNSDAWQRRDLTPHKLIDEDIYRAIYEVVTELTQLTSYRGTIDIEYTLDTSKLLVLCQ